MEPKRQESGLSLSHNLRPASTIYLSRLVGHLEAGTTLNVWAYIYIFKLRRALYISNIISEGITKRSVSNTLYQNRYHQHGPHSGKISCPLIIQIPILFRNTSSA